jgi:hypothetical protein
VATDTSQPTPKLIDSFISAEIPDLVSDPLAYALVAEHMVHGPCGKLNPKPPCMKDGKCTKNYLKPFHDETSVDENGFAIYRRRDDGKFILKGNIKLDNRWIVPYNPTLLKKYQAHINVEWCNKTILSNIYSSVLQEAWIAVKYIFKE